MATDVVTVTLAQCEQTIEKGLATFVEVGEALLRIRDERLYRESYGTFEDYCRDRWGFSRERGRQLIQAAQVVEAVPTIVGIPSPATESVARELVPLKEDPDVLSEAWAEAVEQHGPTPTAAQVKEVVDTKRPDKMAVHYSSATDEWATPQALYDQLHEEFCFDLDVCALDTSAKCERYYTPETDGLNQEWRGTCWMNPPYGDVISTWVKKAHDSALDGATVVCLLPARVDTGWWWDYCRHGEIRFLKGRLKFGEATSGAPFPSAVVVFGPRHSASVVWWER